MRLHIPFRRSALDKLFEERAEEAVAKQKRGEIVGIEGHEAPMLLSWEQMAAELGVSVAEIAEYAHELVEANLLQVLLWPHETPTGVGAFLMSAPLTRA